LRLSRRAVVVQLKGSCADVARRGAAGSDPHQWPVRHRVSAQAAQPRDAYLPGLSQLKVRLAGEPAEDARRTNLVNW